jgi:hypothetical protein
MEQKDIDAAIEAWSNKIFAKTQSNQTSDREIERVRQREMDLSEVR